MVKIDYDWWDSWDIFDRGGREGGGNWGWGEVDFHFGLIVDYQYHFGLIVVDYQSHFGLIVVDN